MATGNVPRGFPRILPWLLAGLMLIIGLAIGILGAKLASVGGTWYFAIMGLVMVIASLLIFRNRRGGIVKVQEIAANLGVDGVKQRIRGQRA